jgi:hypothetical protein
MMVEKSNPLANIETAHTTFMADLAELSTRIDTRKARIYIDAGKHLRRLHVTVQELSQLAVSNKDQQSKEIIAAMGNRPLRKKP